MNRIEDIKDTILVYTDGGAKNNGKPSCTAAWGVFFEDGHSDNEVGKIHIDPSNQKAELHAIKMALTKLWKRFSSKDELGDTVATGTKGITIVSDSKYSIDCCTTWWKSWMKNGWRNYKKEPVAHRTIIQDCLNLMDQLASKGKPVKFVHVISHCIPPKDVDSLQYQLWYGNYAVDKMVSRYLQNEHADFVGGGIPTGKPVYIDWNGKVTSMEEPKKAKRKDKDGVVCVTW